MAEVIVFGLEYSTSFESQDVLLRIEMYGMERQRRYPVSSHVSVPVYCIIQYCNTEYISMNLGSTYHSQMTLKVPA